MTAWEASFCCVALKLHSEKESWIQVCLCLGTEEPVRADRRAGGQALRWLWSRKKPVRLHECLGLAASTAPEGNQETLGWWDDYLFPLLFPRLAAEISIYLLSPLSPTQSSSNSSFMFLFSCLFHNLEIML